MTLPFFVAGFFHAFDQVFGGEFAEFVVVGDDLEVDVFLAFFTEAGVEVGGRDPRRFGPHQGRDDRVRVGGEHGDQIGFRGDRLVHVLVLKFRFEVVGELRDLDAFFSEQRLQVFVVGVAVDVRLAGDQRDGLAFDRFAFFATVGRAFFFALLHSPLLRCRLRHRRRCFLPPARCCRPTSSTIRHRTRRPGSRGQELQDPAQEREATSSGVDCCCSSLLHCSVTQASGEGQFAQLRGSSLSSAI